MTRSHMASVIFRLVAAFLGVGLTALILPQGGAAATAADQAAQETQLGAQISHGIESHYRVVSDPILVERITRVGETLARVVERQDLTYHFKILDIPGVNALSIPGGWVYVTIGMMKFVRTDDELAAVLAHELTHVTHRHYYIQQQRQGAMLPTMIIAAAISVLAGSPAPLLAGQTVTQGAMANYQRDLEKEADLTGVSYLMKTSYSPVAMLTLMEHLAQAEKLNAHPDLGIYQDHPYPDERVAYIRADLIQLGVPIIRRIPEGYLKLTLDPPAPENDQPLTILVDGRPILRLTASPQVRPPGERVKPVLAQLNAFFDTDPAAYDVRAVSLLDHWSVVGGQHVLYEVAPQDAASAQMSPQALAEDVRARLAQVISAAPYNRRF